MRMMRRRMREKGEEEGDERMMKRRMREKGEEQLERKEDEDVKGEGWGERQGGRGEEIKRREKCRKKEHGEKERKGRES